MDSDDRSTQLVKPETEAPEEQEPVTPHDDVSTGDDVHVEQMPIGEWKQYGTATPHKAVATKLIVKAGEVKWEVWCGGTKKYGPTPVRSTVGKTFGNASSGKWTCKITATKTSTVAWIAGEYWRLTGGGKS